MDQKKSDLHLYAKKQNIILTAMDKVGGLLYYTLVYSHNQSAVYNADFSFRNSIFTLSWAVKSVRKTPQRAAAGELDAYTAKS